MDIFISYSSRDSETAQLICAALEEAGLSCWIAPRNILSGQTWSEAIIDGINAAEGMLLLYTAASNASPQVMREVERAVSKRLGLITVRVEDVAPSKAMEYLVSVSHWHEAHTPPFEDHLQPLLQSVQALLARRKGGEEAAPALPPAPAQPIETAAPPTNLPEPMTSFIGREKELAEVRGLLTRGRMVTLTATGGSGKTRLALKTGADLLQEYPDGVWLVELAALTDPTRVAQMAAETLALREEPDRTLMQTLTQSLKDKTMLLLLDNCEHLLAGAAALADTLLKQCPHLRLLATSRERLGIAGEQTYPLPCLTLPDAAAGLTADALLRFEAARLFLDRALLSKPDFTVTDASAPSLASICRRLDGIPLAIELAAARVRALPLEEINTRLDNRFRLLTGGSRTALPHQQTLKALLDWSYDLLSAQEKTLLHRLSAFAGGWTLEAAEGVCAWEEIEEWEVMALLLSLADKSLVVYEERDGQARYRLLETVRAYAGEKLALTADATPCRERHRDFFLALAEAAAPHLQGRSQAVWMERLEAEHDNLRAALRYSREEEGGGEIGLRMAVALRWFWHVRGYLSEGREWMEGVLAHPGAQQRTGARALALTGTGSLVCNQGDYALARDYQEQALEIFRQLEDRPGIAIALNNLGLLAQNQGDYAAAARYQQESLEIHRETGARKQIAHSLNNLGLAAYSQGDYAQAQPLFEESLAIFRELEAPQGIAWALSYLGNIAKEQGDYGQARALYQQSLEICRELKDRWGSALWLGNLANVAAAQGDLPAAQALYAESLAIFREMGDRQGVAITLGNLAGLLLEQGELSPAQALYQESLEIARALGDRQGVAGTLHNLGEIALQQSDFAGARSLLEESLTLQQELGDRLGVTGSLEAFADFALKSGRPEQAARLWGAAEALRLAMGTLRKPKQQQEHEAKAAQVRSTLGEAAFSVAWAEGEALSPEQAAAAAKALSPV